MKEIALQVSDSSQSVREKERTSKGVSILTSKKVQLIRLEMVDIVNADKLKDLFEYHFAINRKMLEYCTDNLTLDQFQKEMGISSGSVRNLFVHIMSTDNRWFSGFSSDALPDFADPNEFAGPEEIQATWEGIEDKMRSYLFALDDDMMDEPFQAGLEVWQVLFHVVNHGTHHRAQISAILRQIGVSPHPQDYVFYVMNRI